MDIYISFGKRLGKLLENQRDEDSSIGNRQKLNMLIILDNLNNRRKKFNEKRILGGPGRQGDRNSRHNRMGERRGKKKRKGRG